MPIKAQSAGAELRWSGTLVILIRGLGMGSHISHPLEQSGEVLLPVSPLRAGGVEDLPR